MNEMIGKIFNNRYEVIEKIGAGGTSVVYKGVDRSLGRAVTIKILREEFAGDADFIRRFQREAQAVAGLSHGNIVSVYDVGIERGLYYIVMEYVEGETLKNYISRNGALPVKEAVSIMLQILDGIDYAHKNGIIHRDIKSQNILFAKDGRIKVTDFGIAVGLNEMTQTYNRATNIMGSVHYIAPEQVQGLAVNEKTDIYSAGIVLYEMLTGRLPFTGETPISVAMKHVQAEVIPPHQINGMVPIGLSYVVLRAMRKAPDMRYNTAKDMAQNIYDVMGSQFVSKNENDADERPVRTGRPERNSDNGFSGGRVREPRRKRNTGKIVGTVLKWIFILLLLCAIGYASYEVYQIFAAFTQTEEDVLVPGVVGKPLDVAQEMLKEAGLVASVSTRYDATIAADMVISQDIAEGMKVRKNRTINIVVSEGAKETVVPVLILMTKKEAEVALTNSKLLYVYDEAVFNDEVPAGCVISCYPETGSRVSEKSVVTLTLSLGPEITEVELEDLRGKSLDDAEAYLASHGLIMALAEEQESLEYAAGKVCFQDVEEGTVLEVGSTVTLALSTGPGPANRQAKVTYNIPVSATGSAVRQEIRIDVEDTIGVHTVYTGSVVSGGTFQQTISFYDYGTIMIYLDNKLVYTRWVN